MVPPDSAKAGDPRAGRTRNKVCVVTDCGTPRTVGVWGAVRKAGAASHPPTQLLRRQLPEELPREESNVPPSSPTPPPPSA